MSDTSSETSSICSTCLEYADDAPPPRKTLLEKQFDYVLNRQQDRVTRRRKNALHFQNLSDRSRASREQNWDIDFAISERYKHVCDLIKQYERESGIVHAPFLSEEEEHLHQLRSQLFQVKTKPLQDKLDHKLHDDKLRSRRPRWYRTFSKDQRVWSLQKRIDDRRYKRRIIPEKEKFDLDWHLNFLRLNSLPFFLDPDNTALQENVSKSPGGTDSKNARKLFLAVIQHHPTRSSLFDNLSAYDIAKLLHVIFPNDTRGSAQSLLGDLQIRQWLNPLRDVFGSDQLRYMLSSVQSHEKSRTSIVLFGPDALELQDRLWNVAGHEARWASQPGRKLRIFYTYRHDDLEKADRFFFDLEDVFMNGIQTPEPDGEPYRGLLFHQTEPFFFDMQAYGRSLRPSSPDPRIYSEHLWAENALYWTPSPRTSASDSPASFPRHLGAITELPAGLELRGGIDHGIPSEVVRFVATRRTDLPTIFDGRTMQHILEIPFLIFTPSPTPAPPTAGSYTLTRNLLTWDPSISTTGVRSETSQRRLARRDHWREDIRRTRHNVYHIHAGKWHRRAKMVRETIRFQATFARMAVLDPKFLWECMKEGEITVFWINVSRWFGDD